MLPCAVNRLCDLPHTAFKRQLWRSRQWMTSRLARMASRRSIAESHLGSISRNGDGVGKQDGSTCTSLPSGTAEKALWW